jgi:hypothetical protein
MDYALFLCKDLIVKYNNTLQLLINKKIRIFLN